MDKCSRKKDPGTKMSREEKKAMRYWKVREAAGENREGACYIKSASETSCGIRHTDLACLKQG